MQVQGGGSQSYEGNNIGKGKLYLNRNNGNGYRNRNGQNNKRKSKMHCTFCNWDNHRKENWYKLVGYPRGDRLYKGNQG